MDIEKALPRLPDPLHPRDSARNHHPPRDSLSTDCSFNTLVNDSSRPSRVQKEPLSSPTSAPCTSEQDVFPQRKRYLTVFGAFLALFCTFGQMNSFGTFQTWYSIHQLNDLPSSTISWIGSLQLWVFFFSGSAIGYFFDMHGPTALMTCGTVCFVLSTVFTSISTHYYQYILSQGILFGVGVGLLFYPPLASVSRSFVNYRATALGIAAGGSSLGGVVYPIMLRGLFDRVGFGWTMRINALMSLVLSVAATLMVSSPKTSSGSNDERKEETGRSSFSKYLIIFGINDSRFLLLIFGSSLVALGLFIPIFYLSSFAHDILGISSSTSFLVIATLNAGGVVGRVAPAIISDRLGHFNILVPSAFLSGLFVLTAWFVPASEAEELFAQLQTHHDSTSTSVHSSLAAVLVFAVLYGVCSGAFISLINPCIVKVTKDVNVVGRRIGFFYTVISFPSLVGGPIAGSLLNSEHGSYHGMILFSGITLIIGSLFLFIARLFVDNRIWARV
ncbi:MFS general substrate transporter [Dendrothele bispora CBS 962.96]|uniref:MFS general substrate transporter n=1 Tax=Dendrothele bispora (strain CBS 962.96) TaxID=1314807 RepID=A0A4S8L8B1_DENBC|nr:MFS general substrate transporter [Dendrothele bispora CBS 962.96]